MLPFEFIDELPDEVPEFIELPDEVDDEPLPIVLPELVLDEGLVVLDDDDDGVAVVSVVVVVVVVLPDVPLVPIVPVLLEGVVVLLLEGVVVLLLEGVVVLLLEGVVVVLLPDGVVVVEPLDDCAIAAPPPISNDAAAMAVVLFKNEPMMMTPDVVETKAHRTAARSAERDERRIGRAATHVPGWVAEALRWSPIVPNGTACRLP